MTKNIQTKIYSKLTYIDFRTQFLLAGHDMGIDEKKYVRIAIEKYIKQLMHLERENVILPNIRIKLLKLKAKLKKDYELLK